MAMMTGAPTIKSVTPQHVSTGWPSLDEAIDHLWIGDNVVWTVEALDDYLKFARSFIDSSLRDGRRLLYLRFAEHAPLVEAGEGVAIEHLDARLGFETFTTAIHRIIAREGPGAFYVFDCLSDLLSAWATDRMIGNFFRVTCPYLYRLDTVAYFGLLHGRHSHETISQIRQTTQVLLSLYRARGHVHVQPLKVDQRSSPTMFLPHVMIGDDLQPVVDSADATRLRADLHRLGSLGSRGHLDYWHRLFLQAAETLDGPPETQQALVEQICQVMISRDERMLALALRYFTLADLVDIQDRMIGTGYIGGKAVGMLLARKVLLSDPQGGWAEQLETHDSFYIGSDAFYSYLVYNGWWELLMRQKSPEGYYEAAAELRSRIGEGEFPEPIRRDFQEMLEYFGQYPILVRSSSLLEDSFSGAFAGKYESVFLVNQGSPETRLGHLLDAVRRVFASSMSPDALAYRVQRGLREREEPMAVLIQRVSGRYRGPYYFPDAAGVGVSHNTYVWHPDMDQRAGMLRLVLGLGTRAVDRLEDDYALLVALDHPTRRPHHDSGDIRRYSQRGVDALNIDAGGFETVALQDLIDQGLDLPMRWATESARDSTVTFRPLLTQTDFAGRLQRLLQTLEGVYEHPVDVEFTLSFRDSGPPLLNLVQCRPLGAAGCAQQVRWPEHVAAEQELLRSGGSFMGGNVDLEIDRIILVDPAKYVALAMWQKYEVARIIGRINRRMGDDEGCRTMLIGPGRWGTSTPSLGVPLGFSELNRMSVLVEVSGETAGMSPDLSFGTHFFHDLVETGIFYIAISPDRGMGRWNAGWFSALERDAGALAGDRGEAADAIRVYDVRKRQVRLVADLVRQEAICFSAG